MDLSIIIPVYNAAPLLDRCLDSIFNQTTQYIYEVILVDDGSTDNSIDIIKARKEKISLCTNKETQGLLWQEIKELNWQKGNF